MRKNLLRGAAGLAIVVALGAAGVYTNGFRQVGPLSGAAPFGVWDHLRGSELIAVDTEALAGAFPQTVAASPFHIAALAAGLAGNAGTASSGAVTISKLMGTITTDSQSLTAGSTYTITLTNTLISATSTLLASVYPLSNTVTSRVVITSITPAAGSATIVIKNEGPTTLNGTFLVPFMVVGS